MKVVVGCDCDSSDETNNSADNHLFIPRPNLTKPTLTISRYPFLVKAHQQQTCHHATSRSSRSSITSPSSAHKQLKRISELWDRGVQTHMESTGRANRGVPSSIYFHVLPIFPSIHVATTKNRGLIFLVFPPRPPAPCCRCHHVTCFRLHTYSTLLTHPASFWSFDVESKQDHFLLGLQ